MPGSLRLVGAKIPVELYNQLDDYWHRHRLRSRTVAIVRALEQLIEDDETPDDRQLRRRLGIKKRGRK